MNEDKPKTVEEMRKPTQQLKVIDKNNGATKAGIFDFHNQGMMQFAVDMAQKFARSEMVPDVYRRKHDNDQGAIMSCLIALDLADRMGASPLMVMQNLSVIKGKPSWSGQYIIAAINQSGRFADPLHFEFFGTEGQMDYGCYAETTTHSGKTIRGPRITMQLAKNEGWLRNPKWVNMPDLMLRYRAGAWFGKTECPELLMGIANSTEEVEDKLVVEKDITNEVVDTETGEIINKAKGKPQKFVDMQAELTAPKADLKVETPKAKSTSEARMGAALETGEIQKDKEESEPEMTNAQADRMTQIQDQGYYEDNGRFFNANGDMWDPASHATAKATGGPIVNTDGSFRIRRGGAVAEKPTETKTAVPDPIPDNPEHEGQQEQMDDDLGDWE